VKIPSDQVLLILVLMHAADVLLKVVKARPYLARVLAVLRGTFVRILIGTYPVDTLLMPGEIVDSREALTSSAAIRY
jgi:hypothetical protein